MDLTALEQHVMLAIMRLHPSAYGVSIQDDLKSRFNRDVAFGTIYACLDRLEEKGFVETRQGEVTPQRGGRRKLYFALTATGQSTLQASLNALNAATKGIKWTETANVL